MLGFVEKQLARDLLCVSDLFVMPSREEGFGLSVAEAQACQVPVLTSAIEPMNEVVDDGHTGYLIEPDHHAGFAERAIELLETEDARRKMGMAGRLWVLGRFSSEAHAKRIGAVYGHVLAKN